MYMNMGLVWIVLICLVQYAHSYCLSIGKNPGFTGPPVVKQVNLTAVEVSWEGLVTNVECADNFVVKSWPASAPGDYILSPIIPTDTFKWIISSRIPRMKFFYQVMAREEKGWNGVDYNKSPETPYRTDDIKMVEHAVEDEISRVAEVTSINGKTLLIFTTGLLASVISLVAMFD